MPYSFNPFTGSFDNTPSVPQVQGVYLPLTGGTITGNLQVSGTTTLSGSTQIGVGLNTTLYAGENVIGVNTEQPNKELTVVGDISATGVIYADKGSSILWNNLYTSVLANSASWAVDSTTDTAVRDLTANWQNTYTSYKDTSATFLTSETDSQTLSFDELTKDLSISNGNTISLSALVDGTATDTAVRALTANWENTYSNVLANSATWALDSTTDTAVRDLTANWENTYTSYKDTSATFLTTETDSQTISFDELTKDLSISNGNTISLSALVDSTTDTAVRALTANWENTYTNVLANSADWGIVSSGNYLPLSGGTITGNLQVSGTTTLSGNTQIGTGINTTLYVESNTVGINTQLPNRELTVVGDISATGVIYADKGSSILWNNLYTNVLANSATWALDSTTDTAVRALTANWQNTYTNVLANSATWALDSTTDTAVRALTANWENTYTSYRDTSATFLTSETDSQVLSFNETTKDLSISNGNIVSLSALVDGTATDSAVRALTANWENTYTNVLANSASWALDSTTDTAVRDLTANWQSTYETVSSLSASWSTADEVLVAQVKNADSVTLNRGDVVYTFGATGDVMSVKLASNASDDTSARTLGVVNETIIPNGTGYVTVAGRIDKLSFPGPFADGDVLWLGNTPGTFTRVKPVAPNHGVYLGVIERANNGMGIAYIKVQNGYELNEIHDVLINGVSAGDVLQRNSSNTLWVNRPLSADKWNSTYTTVQNNSAAWGLITSYSLLIGDSTTNPLTATHNLNTKDIIFSVREVATDKIVYAAGRTIDNNNIELSFNATPSINQYDLTVLCNGGIAGTGGGTANNFALVKVTTTNYAQNATYTHNLYDDTTAGGQITVTLLPPAYHVAVTQHKKIGSTASVVLSAPNGVTIDGQPAYTLMNQYESIGIYTDGSNYFIE